MGTDTASASRSHVPSARPRRRPRAGLGALAGALVLAAAVLIGELSAPPVPTPAEELRAAYEAQPGVAFAVPVDLPDGYDWLGPGTSLGSGPDQIRTARLIDPDTAGLVMLCSASSESALDLCPFSPRIPVVDRTVDGTPVRIGLLTRGVDVGLWRTVALTTDLSQPWLRES